MKAVVLCAVAATFVAAFVVCVVPVQAHHSHAMFDGTREVLIEGSITGVRFANPHVYVQVRAARKDGVELNPPETWAIEMSTVQNQTQRGLTPTVLTYGATIAVKANPLFSGERSGNYTSVVMINGVRNASNGEDWKPSGGPSAQ
jgi:hypothetical protein